MAGTIVKDVRYEYVSVNLTWYDYSPFLIYSAPLKLNSGEHLAYVKLQQVIFTWKGYIQNLWSSAIKLKLLNDHQVCSWDCVY